MKVRIISSIVALIFAVVVFTQFNNIIFNLVALAIFSIAIYEIEEAFKQNNTKKITLLLWLFGALLIMRPYLPFKISVFLMISGMMLLFAMIVVFNFDKINFSTVSANMAFGIYIIIGVFSIVNLKVILPFDTFGWDAAFLFVYVAAVSWGGDTCAYFAGFFFGKHKLAPTLSPKKTIEGAIGGVIGSVVVSNLFLFWYSILKPVMEGTTEVYVVSLTGFIIYSSVAVVGSLVGIIGDLFASAVKRQVGIKDYGKIMPGHGGVMDRFDSFLLVSPIATAIILNIIEFGGVFSV